MKSTKPILYIIVPCYNEEKVLPITIGFFIDKISSLACKGVISKNSKIVFVNDGSSDSTWSIITNYSVDSKYVEGISLSRNRGHQNALLAGLMECKDKCDITISIDCDGQDDINAVDEMVDFYNQGYDIVYGVRSKRETDTFFKRFTAEFYYKLLNTMGAEVIYNHSDYRLTSRKVLDALSNFKEVNLYLRGLFPLIGYKYTTVYYEREERIAGKSHYPLKKMLNLAFDGITSLSITPIRYISFFGIFVSIVSFIVLIFSIIDNNKSIINTIITVSCIICFILGIQLLSIGIIGEYIGKIYLETKARPRYIVDSRTF